MFQLVGSRTHFGRRRPEEYPVGRTSIIDTTSYRSRRTPIQQFGMAFLLRRPSRLSRRLRRNDGSCSRSHIVQLQLQYSNLSTSFPKKIVDVKICNNILNFIFNLYLIYYLLFIVSVRLKFLLDRKFNHFFMHTLRIDGCFEHNMHPHRS